MDQSRIPSCLQEIKKTPDYSSINNMCQDIGHDEQAACHLNRNLGLVKLYSDCIYNQQQ